MDPLYFYLDRRFYASPEFPSPQARALELLAGYSFAVGWRQDAQDGLVNLDEAIALAIAKAIELRQQVVVIAQRPSSDDHAWDEQVIFTAGPNQHRVQRARRRR